MPCCASTGSISKLGRKGAALSAVLLLGGVARSQPSAAPQRLAIYYGYPSLVNGANGDLARAVAVFSEYDVIVLGDGLEVDGAGRGAGPAEHAFAVRLIEHLRDSPRRSEVYGYVDLGRTQQLPLDEIVHRIDLWARMGAAGVLLDEAGYDFGVTRERQNVAIGAAHARGLSACVNAFEPADVFGTARTPLNAAGGGNPSGAAPIVSARDAVLLESFAIRNSVAQSAEMLWTRTRMALEGRARFGTRVFAVSTTVDTADAATLAQYGWWTAAALGLDAYGWGMPSFSAITSQLPWVRRPEAEAALADARYVDEATLRDGRLRRTTTVGSIVVDSTRHSGALEPR
jgi:hypothetical protein